MFLTENFWYMAAVPALIILSVIDWRRYEIPVGCNIWIGAMGAGNLITKWASGNMDHVFGLLAGAISVSGFLQLILVLSKGKAMGGGDVKLTAAAGLLLGWKGILWAFILGCMAGAVIHPFLMIWKKKDHMLAFGPYLAFGICVAMIWQEELTNWYFHWLTMG